MTTEQLLSLARPLIAFAIAVAVLLVVRHLLLRWIRRKGRESSSFAMVFVHTIRVASVLWCLAAGLAIALRISELTPRQMQMAAVLIVAFLIVSFTLVAASVGVRMAEVYGERAGIPFAVAGLSRTLIWIFFLSLGALMLVDYLGLSITPWLTALGVGGLAVALALRETLANFFAGIHILMERPLTVGDWIRLSTGEEGIVTDVGWRTTRVLTGANDMVVIPNTNITSGTLTNYSHPSTRELVEIAFIAGHGADPERVIRVALDAGRQAAGVLADPPPVVLFDPGYTPTHLGFKLLVNVDARSKMPGVQSAIRMALLRRFQQDKIPVPSVQMAPQ